jgi:Zn-dependent M32 family carboxypeptidase
MLNYALGAIITAELRARVKESRRNTAGGADPGWYPWLVQHLYRFGRERPSRDVIEAFLGRPLSPRALLDDIAQLKDR